VTQLLTLQHDIEAAACLGVVSLLVGSGRIPLLHTSY
jgi:hypothetical protein